MIHKAVQAGVPLPIFTIDTGLLFPETLELKRRLENFFEVKIEPINPEQTPEEQAKEHGPELWNRAPDLCCTMRKVLPLQKKLETLAVWITGLRRQQSDTRQRTQILELYHFDVLLGIHRREQNPVQSVARSRLPQHRVLAMHPCGGRGGQRAGGALDGI
jgi:phosphoadenosine phosphosulfate reductase